MQCRIVIGAAAVLLIASFCDAQTQAAVESKKGDAKQYSRVIRAEMKAGALAQHDIVCLLLPDYSDPGKSLLRALRSDGLNGTEARQMSISRLRDSCGAEHSRFNSGPTR